MAKKGKSAYGAPAEEKEMVVTIDRRLLFGGLLVATVAVFGGFGYWMALRGASPQVATTSGSNPVVADAAATARIEADMRAVDLDPDKVSVVGQKSMMQPLDPSDIPAGLLDPVDPDTADLPPDAQSMLDDLGGQAVDVTKPNSADASKWPHDVLANFEDPNVTNQDYAPIRPEDVDRPLDGPRLGISDLNTIYTYDFGVVPMNEPVNHDFTAQNVGDEDLIISRVYTGCGCTATKINDTLIDAAGWLPEPMTLAPGESAKFTVEFDPRAENRAGAQSKFIQIYSNDSTRAMFDPQDPLSHETRFRIVVEPKFGVTWESIEADKAAEAADDAASDAEEDEAADEVEEDEG